MSKPKQAHAPANAHAPAHAHEAEVDVVESIVPMMPIVLPIVGGVMMFLIAFIAVMMG